MDVTVNKNQLKIVAEFQDEDDRTITIDNPADSIAAGDSISSAAIKDLTDFIADTQVILGDKNKANFKRIKSARVVRGTTKYYDLD